MGPFIRNIDFIKFYINVLIIKVDVAVSVNIHIKDNAEETLIKWIRRDYTPYTWNGEDIVRTTTLKNGHGNME